MSPLCCALGGVVGESALLTELHRSHGGRGPQPHFPEASGPVLLSAATAGYIDASLRPPQRHKIVNTASSPARAPVIAKRFTMRRLRIVDGSRVMGPALLDLFQNACTGSRSACSGSRSIAFAARTDRMDPTLLDEPAAPPTNEPVIIFKNCPNTRHCISWGRALSCSITSSAIDDSMVAASFHRVVGKVRVFRSHFRSDHTH